MCLFGLIKQEGKDSQISRCDGAYQQQQGILIPQSKNFNSLDNIFTEYSKILYLEGLTLNRDTV